MPRLLLKNLKRLPVQTAGGVLLGRVQDVIMETDGQTILQYIVKSTMLSPKTYLISRDQIRRIDQTAIIVDDTVRADEKTAAKKTASLPAVAMREEI